MFLWVRVSKALVGEVDRVDDTVICTELVYLNLVAFAPHRSFVRYLAASDGSEVMTEIPTVTRSAVSGYLRNWGILAAVLLGLGGLGVGLLTDSWLAALLGPALGAGTGFGSRWLMSRIGRLSEEEQNQRRIYGAWIGPAVDPVLCGAQLDPWVDRLRGFLASRARGADALGYRSAPRTRKACFDAALASDDVTQLGAAFTLARAEMARTRDRAEIAELGATHSSLWKLLAGRVPEAAAVPGSTLIWTVDPIPGKSIPARRFFLERPQVWIPLLATFVALISGIGLHEYLHPALYLLNLSKRPDLEMLVDGEPVRVSLSAGGRAMTTQIGTGEHTLETRDAVTGEPIDRSRIRVVRGDRAVVYAPAREAGSCLAYEKVIYGKPFFSTSEESRMLDPEGTAWALPAPVDYLLVEPPAQISLDRNSSGDTRWALREVWCPGSRPAAH